MINRRKRLSVVLGLIFAALVSLLGVIPGQPTANSSPLIEVSMTGSIRGSTAIYSITVKNSSTSPVQDVFVAGSIPAGAILERSQDTPEGSWFRGFEAQGTSIQSAVWLASSIPANGTLGPFTYVVNQGSATGFSANAFVHFRLPNDGTALSPVIDLTRVAAIGTQADGRFHDTHSKKLSLTCGTCHGANAASYSDPLANVSNPVDKTACLGCHSSGQRPFYGDKWDTVTIR